MNRALSMISRQSGSRDSMSVRTTTFFRRFKSMFGTTPIVTAIAWEKCSPHVPGADPKHLLWAMLFLKQYASEEVHSAMADCDEKTFRKWCWHYVGRLQNISVVMFEQFKFSMIL